MTREAYLEELRYYLSDVSEGEREEAVQYYNDYFDDAVDNDDEKVIESLGNPKDLAESIKRGLNGDNAGEFSETGYADNSRVYNHLMKSSETDHSNQNASGYGSYGNIGDNSKNDSCCDSDSACSDCCSNGQKGSNGKTSNTLVIIILCIVFSPLIFSAIGVIFSIIGTGIGLGAALIASALGLFLGACGVIVGGIAMLPGAPLGGICMFGIALVLFALGLLGIWLTVGLIYAVIKSIPWLISLIKSLWNKFFGKNDNAVGGAN